MDTRVFLVTLAWLLAFADSPATAQAQSYQGVMAFNDGKFVADARVGNRGGGFAITANDDYIFSGDVVVSQPNVSDIGERVYVIERSPLGEWSMISWQKSPFTADGKFVPVDWDPGEKTGLSIPKGAARRLAQRGMRNAADSTVCQMYGDTVGAYLNSADLSGDGFDAAGNPLPGSNGYKQMITPSYKLRPDEAIHPWRASDSRLQVSLDLQIPTAVCAEKKGSLAYANPLLTLIDPKTKLKISWGPMLFANRSKGDHTTPLQNISYDAPSHSWMIRDRLVPKASWLELAPGSASYQTAPWRGWRHFSWSVSHAHVAAALKAMREQEPQVRVSTDPDDYQLTSFHLNAETHFQTAPAELGWSMRNLRISVTAGAVSGAETERTLKANPLTAADESGFIHVFEPQVSLATAAAPPSPAPRNIILILADDLGYHSLSAYGSDEFRTPNLDSLARSGMVFTQCHARAMCSPTRTVLLGGRTLDRASMGQVPPQSMAEVLAAGGLDCSFSGKWMQRNMPWNHGFAEGLVQVNWYKYYGPHFVVFNSGGYLREHNLPEPLPEKMQDRDLPVEGDQAQAFKLREAYGPEVLNRFALDFIDRHKDRRFFLYYPMKLPHAPVLPTPDSKRTPEIERLIETARDIPVEDHGYSLVGGKGWQGDVVAYIDKMVGRLLAKLDEEGLREETLVVFTSDNGPGTDGAVRGGVERLPGSKGGVLDGATRVPCLVSWPAGVKAGTTCDALVDFTDFLPTFVELAGGELPSDTAINGVSFAKVLRGQESGARQWIYIHDGWHPNPAGQELYDGQSWSGTVKAPPGQQLVPRVHPPYSHIKAFRYVRGERYKLYSDGRFYDLANDLHERQPIPQGAGSPEAERNRAALQQVLASFPTKQEERL